MWQHVLLSMAWTQLHDIGRFCAESCVPLLLRNVCANDWVLSRFILAST